MLYQTNVVVLHLTIGHTKNILTKFKFFNHSAFAEFLYYNYILNGTTHKDLQILIVKQTAICKYKHFHNHLLNHPSPLIKNLSSYTTPNNPHRRLKDLGVEKTFSNNTNFNINLLVMVIHKNNKNVILI